MGRPEGGEGAGAALGAEVELGVIFPGSRKGGGIGEGSKKGKKSLGSGWD